MWISSLLIAYGVLWPALALMMVKRFAWARALGPVLLCCAAGIALVNQPLWAWPEPWRAAMSQLARSVSAATIPLAIPLLLLQARLHELRAQGRPALLSFGLASASVCVAALLSAWWWGPTLSASSHTGHVTGMILSVYIGGTPNLVAVQQALGADQTTFGLVYAATTFASTFYLVALLTVAKPLLRRVFAAHPAAAATPQPLDDAASAATPQDAPAPEVRRVRRWRVVKHGAISLTASACAVGLSVVVGAGVTGSTRGESFSLVVILTLTTLSLVGSLHRPLRQVPTHEPLGTFLILIFCVFAGMMMDLSALAATGGAVLQVTATTLALSVALHLASHRAANLDVDTTLIMSVATIFGPPFVPAVAQALGNRSVLVPGMTLGFLGYAVGTYLGVAVGAWLGP